MAGASHTMGTFQRIRFQTQEWPAKAIADPAADDHKRCHPVDSVTKREMRRTLIQT